MPEAAAGKREAANYDYDASFGMKNKFQVYVIPHCIHSQQ